MYILPELEDFGTKSFYVGENVTPRVFYNSEIHELKYNKFQIKVLRETGYAIAFVSEKYAK